MKNIISIILVLTAINVAFAGQSTDSSGIITKNGYPDRVVRPFPTKRGPQIVTSLQLYRTGMQYYNGIRTDQNFTSAVNYFKLSAEKGNTDAQYMLGVCYKNGKGIKKNKKAAKHWFEESAKGDNTRGIFELANCYYNGTGTKRDYKKAAGYYLTAANAGLADAQYMAGLCYKKGKGVKKDYEEARKWFVKAMENGCDKAKKECESLPESKLPH